MNLSLNQILERIGGRPEGYGDLSITGVNALNQAQSGEITFAESLRYLEAAKACAASAIVAPADFPDIDGKVLIRCDKPRETFFKIMTLFAPSSEEVFGIHESAVIAATAVLQEGVRIGEHAVIREEVKIGRGTIIESGVHIGRSVHIGEKCRIGPNVSLLRGTVIGDRVTIHAGTVIGGEGFGYLWLKDHHHKIPQLGSVRIDDDVEIGCNVCIDRATLGITRIRRGTKIDNLVQIAHNNDIGEDCIIVSHVGLSGSVTLGNRVTLAGQVGVADHITIGEGATAAARTGISKNVKKGETVWGAPNRPMKQVLREFACIAKLPDLFAKVKALALRIETLEKRIGE